SLGLCLPMLTSLHHAKREALFLLDRHQFDPCLRLWHDHPTRSYRDGPTVPFRHRHLDTVKIDVAPPAFFAGFVSLFQNPVIDLPIDALLCRYDFAQQSFVAADEMQRTPRQESGYRIEIGRKHITSQLRCREGDGSGSRKGITDLESFTTKA